jgi:hypothetical protein
MQNANYSGKKTGKFSSTYTGVGFKKKVGKWQAHITVANKLIHLGLFASELEAAAAYKAAAKMTKLLMQEPDVPGVEPELDN